ncbi:MAG: TIGR03087 family PEP-CTERM/XrtA system glycosyltransferase [Planctomycetota bacterium]
MGRIEVINGQARQDEDTCPLPRVLLLTHRVPCPPDRGDRIRSYHLLRALSRRANVTLGAISDEPLSRVQRDLLGSLVEVALVLPTDRWAMRRRAGMALLTGRAITPGAHFHPGLARALAKQHRRQPFDTVVTYCSGMLAYTRGLLGYGGANRPRHILDLVDVDSVKWSQYAERARGPMGLVYAAEARRLRRAEAGELVHFDAVTLISEQEREAYRQRVTSGIEPVVAGNGVDLTHFVPEVALAEADREPVVVFTGVLSYRPNIDAAAWFARRVMPRVLAAAPRARFDIIGKSPTAEVLALGELPGVRVVGPVTSTADHLRGAALAVAPLRIAPGLQNKVLEAMACGRPVVCSPEAAAGIDATPGTHLLVADDDAATARQVVSLLHNPEQRARLGDAARQQVETHYDWPARLSPLLDLILKADIPRNPIGTPTYNVQTTV